MTPRPFSLCPGSSSLRVPGLPPPSATRIPGVGVSFPRMQDSLRAQLRRPKLPGGKTQTGRTVFGQPLAVQGKTHRSVVRATYGSGVHSLGTDHRRGIGRFSEEIDLAIQLLRRLIVCKGQRGCGHNDQHESDFSHPDEDPFGPRKDPESVIPERRRRNRKLSEPELPVGEHDPGKREECDPWNVPFGPGKASSPLSGEILLSVQSTIPTGELLPRFVSVVILPKKWTRE